MRKFLALALLWITLQAGVDRVAPIPASQAASDSHRRELEQLAQQGDGEALFALALLYDTGNTPEAEQQRVITLYQQAAERGIGAACLYLGMKYEFGNGVPRDISRAISLYKEAAEQGFPMAQFFLGRIYLQGRETKPVPEQAYFWLTKAAKAGYPGAEQLARRAEKLLTSGSSSTQTIVDPEQTSHQ